MIGASGKFIRSPVYPHPCADTSRSSFSFQASGYSVEPATADQALLNMMYAMRGGLIGVLRCALSEECRDLKALMRKLGSKGANYITWTAEELQQAFFSTYPHQPTPVDPGLLALSLGLSNTPIIGDLYDLYTGVTGYDPVTGQYLAGWERLANLAGAIPILGLSGANIRHGVHAAESLIDSGDELAQFIGKACSFDKDTSVATSDGSIPIGEIDVGDQVLAWDEVTDTTGYYTVTATTAHWDPVIVHLTIDGETINTTPEHPFYSVNAAPWLSVGETEGRWTPASKLQVGDSIQRADGTTGVIEAIVFEATQQLMYNLTVADAHTFFVGNGEWLVHNHCTKYSNVTGAIQKPLIRDLSANAGSLVPSRLDEIPAYGIGWNGRPTDQTLGILEVPGHGDIYLESKYDGPSALLPRGTPGMHNTVKPHVEAHAAAITRLEGIQNAVLYLNQSPCELNGRGCRYMLSFMLPSNTTLVVVAPNGYSKAFKGR